MEPRLLPISATSLCAWSWELWRRRKNNAHSFGENPEGSESLLSVFSSAHPSSRHIRNRLWPSVLNRPRITTWMTFENVHNDAYLKTAFTLERTNQVLPYFLVCLFFVTPDPNIWDKLPLEFKLKIYTKKCVREVAFSAGQRVKKRFENDHLLNHCSTSCFDIFGVVCSDFEHLARDCE